MTFKLNLLFFLIVINKQIAFVYKCFFAVAFPCALFQLNPIKTLSICLSETVNELLIKWMKLYLTKKYTIVSDRVFSVPLRCQVIETQILKRLNSKPVWKSSETFFNE